MRKEELLAGQLLSLFSTYKRRQCGGTVQFYSDRLLGLEDALLQARHQLLLITVRIYFLLSMVLHRVACFWTCYWLPAN